MTRTSTLLAAISSLFVCSAAVAQSAVDIGVYAGADTLHVTEILPGYGVQAHDIASPGQIDALYQIVSSQKGKWRRPPFDAPSLRWRIEFRRAGKLLGECDIGSNFLAVNGYLHSLKPQEQQQIRELLRE
jgi:hypothetical protein